ncbi:ester cyclase [Amnibacterium flavum]|uniref:Ester cyclase n=1 Tax=Amnibacterium flavum TaxID=2173173 RepID=A0A2V1HW93_9MICO|nr:ester cyclase [Amnibacterium flavum]PVZ96112.1 ester cyclase [Amnibacterium flavum]
MTTTLDTRQNNLEAQERLGAILEGGDLDRLAEVFADDVVDHDPAPGQAPGVAGIIDFWKTFTTAFPDLEAKPQLVSADDDHVTVALELTGTHQGDFLGHAATGRSFTARGIQIGRFENGKLVERWGASDELGILTQLGLV